jgi:hypothetical protein
MRVMPAQQYTCFDRNIYAYRGMAEAEDPSYSEFVDAQAFVN